MQRYSKLANMPKLGYCLSVRSVPIARPRIHNVQKRLGPELLAQLVAEYRAGSATTALMAKYHIGKGTVLGVLHEAGVIRSQRRATSSQLQEAAELYNQGWSLERVGQHLGFEDSPVWLWLKQLDVPRRRPWERGEADSR
jgi:hypothetical protein